MKFFTEDNYENTGGDSAVYFAAILYVNNEFDELHTGMQKISDCNSNPPVFSKKHNWLFANPGLPYWYYTCQGMFILIRGADLTPRNLNHWDNVSQSLD